MAVLFDRIPAGQKHLPYYIALNLQFSASTLVPEIIGNIICADAFHECVMHLEYILIESATDNASLPLSVMVQRFRYHCDSIASQYQFIRCSDIFI